MKSVCYRPSDASSNTELVNSSPHLAPLPSFQWLPTALGIKAQNSLAHPISFSSPLSASFYTRPWCLQRLPPNRYVSLFFWLTLSLFRTQPLLEKTCAVFQLHESLCHMVCDTPRTRLDGMFVSSFLPKGSDSSPKSRTLTVFLHCIPGIEHTAWHTALPWKSWMPQDHESQHFFSCPFQLNLLKQ